MSGLLLPSRSEPPRPLLPQALTTFAAFYLRQLIYLTNIAKLARFRSLLNILLSMRYCRLPGMVTSDMKTRIREMSSSSGRA